MKNPLSRLVLLRPATVFCLLGLTLTGNLAAEGVFGLNWQEAGPSFPTDRWVGNAYVSPGRTAPRLLSESSDPVSPFPGGSILVDNPKADGRFMLRARPFMEGQKKGWINFEVTLLQGQVQLTIGQNPKPYETRNDQALLMGTENSQLTVRLEAGKEIGVTKEYIVSPQVSVLEVDKPYQIRISWDFTGDVPAYTISINGEPTSLLRNGAPFSARVTPAQAAAGADSFSITTPRETDSRYIIGNVKVSE